MAVFVLDKRGRPLMPCTERRARILLARKRARVHRVVPFVIRLVDRTVEESKLQPLRCKNDPGSKKTGMALTRIADDGGEVVLNLFELQHRGLQISEALTARGNYRRRRRSHLRYRAPRFENRRKVAGWLPPSLQHRIDTTMSWVNRMRRWAPVTSLAMELVRFDMQAMENPDIEGVQYQQGTLCGYEVREYLLEKFGRKCVYCGKEGVPLQVEHVVPKSRGGSDRVSNLVLSCQDCNQKKGSRSIEEFLAKKPELLARIQKQQRTPLRDAASVNATRWALYSALKKTGLPVEAASGGRTKWNRNRLGVPKSHALDAACVGSVVSLSGWQRPTLTIKCTGRGSYQRTNLDRYGFPRGYLMRKKLVYGFQTGDLVRAVIPKGKHAGTHKGRVAVRVSGSFNITTASGIVQGISHRYCHVLQRADGYGYALEFPPPRAIPPPNEFRGFLVR